MPREGANSWFHAVAHSGPQRCIQPGSTDSTNRRLRLTSSAGVTGTSVMWLGVWPLLQSADPMSHAMPSAVSRSEASQIRVSKPVIASRSSA